jgi:hypothetical protein|tara:strand:+ start:156 stop:329 length:174 start_codon:yes stop_codon:yes gene_type:complete
MLNIEELDEKIWEHVIVDLHSGTLLLESDDETLDLILTEIWESIDQYQQMGLVVGVS